jgi:hypothetical protein
MQIGRIFLLSLGMVSATQVVEDGVVFRISLMAVQPFQTSQITFVASEIMDGGMVECVYSNGSEVDTRTLQVEFGGEDTHDTQLNWKVGQVKEISNVLGVC